MNSLSIAGGTSSYQGTGFHPGTDATKPSFTWIDTNEDRTIQASGDEDGGKQVIIKR